MFVIENHRLRKSQDEEDIEAAKQPPAGDSSISSTTLPEANEEITTPIEKSVRKPIAFSQNGGDEQVLKKKRGRKPKSETDDNLATPTITDNQPRTKTPPENKSSGKSKRKSRKSEVTNGNEIEHESLPSSIIHLIQASNPPLSNYEQKQIVDGLLHHPNETNLTFDEAQTFAINKATEIIYENHNYRMKNISSEWFYEAILLRYPAVVFKYRSWFENVKVDDIPNGNDMIKLKQWQIALMLHAQIKAEQQQQQQNLSNEN